MSTDAVAPANQRPAIRRLDAALVNKIAAGEVIERPASVVKELIENSLDAGATRIDVALEDGGTSLIAVTDDGGGIPPEELPLALAPHATSKIAGLDDLSAIVTMGFRGEALASIASISRMRITSRTPDRPDAARIDACDGDVSPIEPCAAPPGTTIEVRNLFFNVPARRKYLRTAAAELGHVTEQIARVALANPQVAISQTHQGRAVRRLPATADRQARIADFFGAELAADLIPVARDEPGLRVEGFFAPPAASRASSKWQYVFLNGRYIRDRDLSGFVLREAFRGLIEPARYPVVFLFLTAPPDSFDVNVHPTKIEVRWRDAGRVKSQVLAVLREALLSRDLTPALRSTTRFEPQADSPQRMAAFVERMRSVTPDARRHDAFERPYAADRDPRHDAGRVVPPSAWRELYAPAATPGADAALPVIRGMAPPAPAAPSAGARPDPAAERQAATNDVAAVPVDGGRATRAIQIHNTYLVCETDEGMVIIDQHALHERILYEEFSRRITRGPLESQRLLLPEVIDASPEQLAALDSAGDLLARLGLEIAPFGPRSAAVNAAPSLLGESSLAAFAADLLDRLADSSQRGAEAVLDDLLAMMACKAAIKAGDSLTSESIDALLARRHLVDRSSNCPHGRPTTLRLTVRDLERQFKRT